MNPFVSQIYLRDKFLVKTERSTACGESEDNRWLCADGSGDNVRGFATDFFVVFFYDDQHLNAFPRRDYGELEESAEPPDDKIVTIGAIDSEDVNQRLFIGRVNQLADAQERFAARHVEELRSAWVSGGRIDYF